MAQKEGLNLGVVCHCSEFSNSGRKETRTVISQGRRKKRGEERRGEERNIVFKTQRR
jgi:hypothetical protein